MKAKSPAPGWLVIVAFFNIYIIWGSTYLAVAFGLKGFPPFILIGLRYLVAGILLLGWCWLKGERLPTGKLLWLQAASGTIMLVGGTGLIAWTEQYISSGQAATLVATEPLLFLLLDRSRWKEYFSNKYIISGLIIGFAGIFIFLKLNGEQGSHSAMATVASLVVLLSAALWVMGSLITKNSQGKSSAVANTSVQLLAAGFACSIISWPTGEYAKFNYDNIPTQAWLGLIFLIIMGSLMAYLSFVWLIARRPPAVVSTHTYVNPVVAVFLGWLMADEHITTGQIFGLFIILTGILLVNLPGYLNSRSPAAITD